MQPTIAARRFRAIGQPRLSPRRFHNVICGAGGTIAAAATATAPIRVAPAAAVRKAAHCPRWPAHDHKEYIQNKERDGNVVEQCGPWRIRPELIRRPEKKGRRQQDRLGQLRRGTTMRQLESHVGTGDRRQGKSCEGVVAFCGKQAWSRVLNQEQHDAGKRRDAHHERNQSAITVIQSLHSSLFSVA